MRWRCFGYSIPWTTAMLLAFTLAAQSLVVWFWFDQQVPPLQQYYLWTYLASSESAKHPGASTRVEWLLKTAPGGKRELAFEPDVIAGRAGDLPVQLSPAAIDQGWTGIEKSSPQRIDSAKLSETLRDDFYDGAGIWLVMLVPILAGCALLIALVCALFSARHELALEWSRVWWEVMEPQSAGNLWQSPAERWGKAWLIRLLSDWKQIISARIRPAKDTPSAGVAETNRPPIAAAIAGQQLASTTVQQPDSVAHRVANPPAIPAAKRPTKRPIFPGRAGVRDSAKPPKPWDESEWID